MCYTRKTTALLMWQIVTQFIKNDTKMTQQFISCHAVKESESKNATHLKKIYSTESTCLPKSRLLSSLTTSVQLCHQVCHVMSARHSNCVTTPSHLCRQICRTVSPRLSICVTTSGQSCHAVYLIASICLSNCVNTSASSITTSANWFNTFGQL